MDIVRKKKKESVGRMKCIVPAIKSLKGGRYHIASVLGAGGFGITYLCLDAKTDKLCAVKEYLPENISARDPVTKDILPYKDRRNEYLHGKRRFLEEAVMLRQMRNLTSIVKILDLFEEHNTAYSVMEYIEGKTVKQLMRECGGKLPFRQAFEILTRCAAALDVVHRSAGLFHRDISPENIMVLPDGNIRIIDFGNAKTIQPEANQQYSIILKPGFAPPEQYSSTMKQGSFTDVYALASTFYYMASGRKVPSAPNRLIGAEYPSLHELVPACSRQISDAVDQALSMDQAKRTQTMEQFLSDLRGEKRPDQRKRTEEETHQESQPEAEPWILVEAGACAGKLFPIRTDRWTSVGRNADKSVIALRGYSEISGLHLFVKYDSGRGCFFLVDQSSNGTYYRGNRLRKNRKYIAGPGTRFLIGGRDCAVLLGEGGYAK